MYINTHNDYRINQKLTVLENSVLIIEFGVISTRALVLIKVCLILAKIVVSRYIGGGENHRGPDFQIWKIWGKHICSVVYSNKGKLNFTLFNSQLRKIYQVESKSSNA